MVRQAGANVIVNRKSEYVVETVRAARHGQGVDRIVDVDFGQNLAANVPRLWPAPNFPFSH